MKGKLEMSLDASHALMVSKIFIETASYTGKDFLKHICKCISQHFDATHVFIAFAMDKPASRVSVAASFCRGQFREGWEYNLQDNPCLIPYSGDNTFIPCGVNRDFSGKQNTNYQAFIGVPITAQNTVIGHVALFFERQLDNSHEIEEIISYFSEKINSEINRMLSEYHVTSALRALELENSQLRYESTHDALTALRNRRDFMNRADIEFKRTQRTQKAIGILYIDLDHFKRINDTYGHETGDVVLIAAGKILQNSTRSATDCAARIGGEELAILMPDSDIDTCCRVAETIRTAVEALRFDQHPDLMVTCSIGVTVSCSTDTALQQILNRADVNLYQAKNTGRNKVVY